MANEMDLEILSERLKRQRLNDLLTQQGASPGGDIALNLAGGFVQNLQNANNANANVARTATGMGNVNYAPALNPADQAGMLARQRQMDRRRAALEDVELLDRFDSRREALEEKKRAIQDAELKRRQDLAISGYNLDESGMPVAVPGGNAEIARRKMLADIEAGQADRNINRDYRLAQIEALKGKTRSAGAGGRGGKSVGFDSLDRAYAKDYNDWTSEGRPALEKNFGLLGQTLETLRQRQGDTFGTSGRFYGRLPDVLKSEESIRLRDDVFRAVQGALKATLGAQFTEREGERIMRQAYNENLSPAENIAKIEAVTSEIKKLAANNEAKANFFENQGTLAGYRAGGGMPAAPGGSFPREMRKNGQVVTVSNEQELREAAAEGWQ